MEKNNVLKELLKRGSKPEVVSEEKSKVLQMDPFVNKNPIEVSSPKTKVVDVKKQIKEAEFAEQNKEKEINFKENDKDKRDYAYEESLKNNARKFIKDLMRRKNSVPINIANDVANISLMMNEVNSKYEEHMSNKHDKNEQDAFSITLNVLSKTLNILNHVTMISFGVVMDDEWMNTIKGVAKKLDVGEDELRRIVEEVYKEDMENNKEK